MTRLLGMVLVMGMSMGSLMAGEGEVVELWEGEVPGPVAMVDGEEVDKQKATDGLVGGKTVMKLGNVARASITIYPAPEETNTGAACVVCPGGGFSILAWDLEGVEIAEWLNSIGVTAVVLKYRVPTGGHGEEKRWIGPVMDAQRALSYVRSQAALRKIDPNKIGILGFSAGGLTAARTALLNGKFLYEQREGAKVAGCEANFVVLVYPAWMVDKDGKLFADLEVTEQTPPMFLVHTADDPITYRSSAELFDALRAKKVEAELHVFRNGGHGYGARPDETKRVTAWPGMAEGFLREVVLGK